MDLFNYNTNISVNIDYRNLKGDFVILCQQLNENEAYADKPRCSVVVSPQYIYMGISLMFLVEKLLVYLFFAFHLCI